MNNKTQTPKNSQPRPRQRQSAIRARRRRVRPGMPGVSHGGDGAGAQRRWVGLLGAVSRGLGIAVVAAELEVPDLIHHQTRDPKHST